MTQDSVYSASRIEANAPAVRKSWFPLFCFLIVALSTALQIGCLNNGLVIDDKSLVFDKDDRGCGNNPIDCFSGKLFYLYYRPMLTASFAVVQKYHIHDDSPRWYHIENLVLHAIVVALALWLFRLVLRRRNAALVAGALFGLHPVQVCVTSFVGGRTDTLALMFILLFAIGIKKAADLFRAATRGYRDNTSNRCKCCALFWAALAMLSFLAALFTKEQVIPLLFITPLLTLPGRPARLGSSGRKGPTSSGPPLWLAAYLIPILIYAIASNRVLKGDTLPHTDWSAGLHLQMVGRSIWYFAKTLFAPTVTTLHQSTLGPWDTPQYCVAALGFVAAALWLLLVKWAWPDPGKRFMALWATLSLVSVINLIPIPSQFASPYRAAIPLLGIAGLLGGILTETRLLLRLERTGNRTHRSVITAALAAAFLWCLVTSMQDVPNWHDEFMLMKAEVSADPNYVQARAALAMYWAQPPEPKYKPNLDKALKEYNVCIDQLFGPNVPPERFASMVRSRMMVRILASASDVRWLPEVYIPRIISGRANVYQLLGQYEDAIRDYSAVRKLNPRDAQNIAALVWCMKAVGDRLMDERSYSDAADTYKSALGISPDDKDVRAALVSAYRIIGRKDRADAVERMEDRFTGQVP